MPILIISMNKLNFNKVFVIESLDDKFKTGKLLFDEVISIRCKFADIKSDFISVNSAKELENKLLSIKEECNQNNIKPIIHFEIHGKSDGLGLVLKNNNYISYLDLTELLRKINIACQNNLFITLAVCHGAWIMQNVLLSKPCPFVGIIGSFETILNKDLYLRYTEFYSEFLLSFDFEKSFRILKNVNNDIPSSYRVLNTKDLFIESYTDYINKDTSDEGIKQRLKTIYDGTGGTMIPTHSNKVKKFLFDICFTEILKATKQEFYEKHSKHFFMIDSYAINRERFNIPLNYKSLFDNPKNNQY